MTTPAERDVRRRFVDARSPVVDQERLHNPLLFGQANLATAVAPEHGFAVPGKVAFGTAVPVIAGAAQTAGDQRRATAALAPPGRLRPRGSHAFLPGSGEGAETGTTAG